MHKVLENGDIEIHPTPPIRTRLWLRDPCCCWCGFLFVDPGFATIEHLQFRSRGGKGTMQNCRLACPRCNQQRERWYMRALRARGVRADRGGTFRREGHGPMQLKPKMVRGAKIRPTAYQHQWTECPPYIVPGSILDPTV